MNILVTGANGQLAKCLKDIVEKNGNGHADSFVGEKDYWTFADRNELDITNMDAVDEYVSKHYINVIVNCAAYTNVAKAEDDYNVPYSANVCGSEILANACKRNGAVLIHISTDYVFDGTKGVPYEPSDEPCPINNYGKSKADGEYLIEHSGCKYLIFRTSWLYSQYGHNFVKTMVKRSLNNESSSVVYDQVGSPTYAGDLARFIYRIIAENNAENRYLCKTGIYHYCNKGVASWYDVAHLAYLLTGDVDKVTCRRTTDSETVKRPSYTVMDTSLTEEIFQHSIPHWEDSFTNAVKKIIKNIQEDAA